MESGVEGRKKVCVKGVKGGGHIHNMTEGMTIATRRLR